MKHPVTPMGRYFVVRGRLWRMANPGLGEAHRSDLVHRLMTARRAVRDAKQEKTYLTSLGFFERAIAAPSMKGALEAWGADSNLFHPGAAKESADSDIVAATTKKLGVVLKRPEGSDIASQGAPQDFVPR